MDWDITNERAHAEVERAIAEDRLTELHLAFIHAYLTAIASGRLNPLAGRWRHNGQNSILPPKPIDRLSR